MIYKHFGKEIVRQRMQELNNPGFSDDSIVETVFKEHYNAFMGAFFIIFCRSSSI